MCWHDVDQGIQKAGTSANVGTEAGQSTLAKLASYLEESGNEAGLILWRNFVSWGNCASGWRGIGDKSF